MSDEYGNDIITITDDEGNEFVLEHLHTLEYNGTFYMAFLPTDMDEDDPVAVAGYLDSLDPGVRFFLSDNARALEASDAFCLKNGMAQFIGRDGNGNYR